MGRTVMFEFRHDSAIFGQMTNALPSRQAVLAFRSVARGCPTGGDGRVGVLDKERRGFLGNWYLSCAPRSYSVLAVSMFCHRIDAFTTFQRSTVPPRLCAQVERVGCRAPLPIYQRSFTIKYCCLVYRAWAVWFRRYHFRVVFSV